MTMTQNTGADLFIDALDQYGVTHVFGNPGTTELPLIEAIADSELEYVLGLHEDIAVGMASGYATTRRYHSHTDATVNPVGVVNLHITPGLAHGLGNIYAAKVAGAPLVVTAGNHSTDFRHEDPALGGDLVAMVEQFTKWSDEVLDVRALPTMLRRAFRIAQTPPTGPVFLGLPLDVMTATTNRDPERLGPIPNQGRGDPTQIDRAADFLVEAERPTMVVGDHVAHSEIDGVESAVELAEAAGAGVYGEILACEVNFPTDHEQWVSFIRPDETSILDVVSADTVLFTGCSTNTTITRHDSDFVSADSTYIHVSDDAWQVGKNYPADAAVVGDPGLILSALADNVRDRVPEQTRNEQLERIRNAKTRSQTERAESADSGDKPISKDELAATIRSVARDAFVVDESVTAKYDILTQWPFDSGQYFSNKGAGLGYGLPAAMGAAIAEEERGTGRHVVCYVGDGSYLYYPQTLYTAVRRGLNVLVVVVDNRNYRILKDNTVDILGGEEEDYDFSPMNFDPPVDIPQSAQSHGACGRLVERSDKVSAALEDALQRDGPDVVDVLVRD